MPNCRVPLFRHIVKPVLSEQVTVMADVANVSTSAAALYAPNARSVAATEHTEATLAVTLKLALAAAARAGMPTSPTRPANTSRAAAWQQRWSENESVWKAIWWTRRRAILGLGF